MEEYKPKRRTFNGKMKRAHAELVILPLFCNTRISKIVLQPRLKEHHIPDVVSGKTDFFFKFKTSIAKNAMIERPLTVLDPIHPDTPRMHEQNIFSSG
jgi:hypothetical protein